jgi:hypothetical protein
MTGDQPACAGWSEWTNRRTQFAICFITKYRTKDCKVTIQR